MIKLYCIMFLLMPFTVLSDTSSIKVLKFFQTVEELQQALVNHNMNNSDEQIHSVNSYKDHYELIPGAHSNPNIYYKKKWSYILSVVKKRKVEFFKTVEELQQAVENYNTSAPKSEQIINGRTYGLFRHNIPGAHSSPRAYYGSAWPGWPEFFGRKKLPVINKTLKQLKQDIVDHNIKHPDKQINTAELYKKYYGFIEGAPARPDISYKDKGWIDWYDLLGKEKIFIIATPKKLKEAIATYNESAPKNEQIINGRTYGLFRHNILGAPASPSHYYKRRGYKINWFYLLGKKKVSKFQNPKVLKQEENCEKTFRKADQGN